MNKTVEHISSDEFIKNMDFQQETLQSPLSYLRENPIHIYLMIYLPVEDKYILSINENGKISLPHIETDPSFISETANLKEVYQMYLTNISQDLISNNTFIVNSISNDIIHYIILRAAIDRPFSHADNYTFIQITRDELLSIALDSKRHNKRHSKAEADGSDDDDPDDKKAPEAADEKAPEAANEKILPISNVDKYDVSDADFKGILLFQELVKPTISFVRCINA